MFLLFQAVEQVVGELVSLLTFQQAVVAQEVQYLIQVNQ
jgi:hypothetical protein